MSASLDIAFCLDRGHFVGVAPAAKKLTAAVAEDKLADAEGPRKKISMFNGIKHLLWFVTLVLMIFKF